MSRRLKGRHQKLCSEIAASVPKSAHLQSNITKLLHPRRGQTIWWSADDITFLALWPQDHRLHWFSSFVCAYHIWLFTKDSRHLLSSSIFSSLDWSLRQTNWFNCKWWRLPNSTLAKLIKPSRPSKDGDLTGSRVNQSRRREANC